MKISNHPDNKEYICHLISQTFEIAVRFLDKNKNILYENIYHNTPNPWYSSKEEYLNELYSDNDPANFPIIRNNNYFENFILINLENNKNFEGTFIIGPSLYFKPFEKMLDRIINNCHIVINKQEIINYYHLIPTIKQSSLIHISVLLYYMIYLQKIDVNTVIEKNKQFKREICRVENPDLYISICHQNNSMRNEIAVSSKMFEAIKSGNKEELIKHWDSFPHKTITVLCITSELRNRKNQAIAGIAIATRYAIDGGLPSDIAFSICELYIQNVEKINDVKSILVLVKEAFCSLTEHVRTCNVRNYSKTITTCQNYISKNIYQEISLKQLAHITNKNSMYLSTMFKKEVGITISEYIHRVKVEEAKKLLTLTNYTLLEISTLLNFNSQSYFTKIFKKNTQITPKQYRNQYTLY
ncbi:AraC family transcriptional regulator [Bacillus sp. JJ864]|uniref:AraC family transcriptional regulator n=1 Tax=Bacillus sp. JJ864 TaxID=3122975 RepID=UPI002FFF76C6